jgi:hypothetical protein
VVLSTNVGGVFLNCFSDANISDNAIAYITQLKKEIQKLKDNVLVLTKTIENMNSTNVDLADSGKSNEELASKLKLEIGKWFYIMKKDNELKLFPLILTMSSKYNIKH